MDFAVLEVLSFLSEISRWILCELKVFIADRRSTDRSQRSRSGALENIENVRKFSGREMRWCRLSVQLSNKTRSVRAESHVRNLSDRVRWRQPPIKDPPRQRSADGRSRRSRILESRSSAGRITSSPKSLQFSLQFTIKNLLSILPITITLSSSFVR